MKGIKLMLLLILNKKLNLKYMRWVVKYINYHYRDRHLSERILELIER